MTKYYLLRGLYDVITKAIRTLSPERKPSELEGLARIIEGDLQREKPGTTYTTTYDIIESETLTISTATISERGMFFNKPRTEIVHCEQQRMLTITDCKEQT